MRRATIPYMSCLLSVLLWTLPVSAATFPGRVLWVVDGDTITVLGPGNAQYRVKLAGIDAPELDQRYGETSKEHLTRRVAGRFVVVEWQKWDRHGALVGKVLVSGEDVCLEQVAAGLAWYDRKHQRDQSPGDRKAYARVEEEASEAKRGLWADPEPLPPWEWRGRSR